MSFGLDDFKKDMGKLISIIVPLYNEEKNISLLYGAITDLWAKKMSSLYDLEIVFVNDGSRDGSSAEVEKLAVSDGRVRLIEFSRNFGKEVATSAGLQHAQGDAAIMIDADLQHPVAVMPELIAKWEAGADMVIGVRTRTKGNDLLRKLGSGLFYRILNQIGEVQIVPNATDYRIIDRCVLDEFNRFTERGRITRGLLDWLGFTKDYVYFEADERHHGQPAYNKLKLLKLAMSTFVAHSLLPLKLAGYLGLFIVLTSGPLGAFIFVVKYFMGNFLNFSGPAILAVINLFLVGITLSSLGIIALYIGQIHSEVTNRPLYVIKKKL
jgi:polyisoprenyl-phosphate glycosyltransferase